MDKSLVFIITSKAQADCLHQILAERGLEFPVYVAVWDTALTIAQQAIHEGAKVVVSKGGTAEYLKERCGVSVVSIRYSVKDISLSYEKARLVENTRPIPGRMALVGFHSVCRAALDFREISGHDLEIVEVSHMRDIPEAISALSRQGIRTVIGGLSVVVEAERQNLDGIMSEVDSVVVAHAVDDALYYLSTLNEKDQRLNLINAILDNASDAIVGMDAQARVTQFSRRAYSLLKCHHGDDMRSLIDPAVMDDVLEKGNSHHRIMTEIHGRPVICACIPLKVGQQITGAVLTVQEEKEIIAIDRQIRKRALGRGHVAKSNFDDIISHSPAMERVKIIAKRFALSEKTILLQGGTGTGKEIVAQSIHNFSSRRDKPFVAINCAALPENIIESELFGYVGGAFTGARTGGSLGVFELAHNGTIFLDEVSEIPLNIQVKLLRVIQEQEITRIGDDKITPINVRIIAATNCNLFDEVRARNFREDLYYRLSVLEINLPSLAERREDIPLLIEYFLRHSSEKNVMRITPEAVRYLAGLSWPGNVRQLQNIVERLAVSCDHDLIELQDVQDVTQILSAEADAAPPMREGAKASPSEAAVPMREMEELMIRDALREARGSRKQAAARLGISTATLWRRMKRMGLLD